MELIELTKALCALPGPSGFEAPVCSFLAEYVRPFSDEVRVDPLGTLLAVRRCGRPGAKTLLLDAHMDEIGLIVTAVEEGFLRFSGLGGIDPRTLPALEVRVLCPEGPVYGVVDTMPPHVLKAEDMDKVFELKDLRIDVGMTQEEAERRIPVGTPVVFAAGCAEMGEGLLCGKSLDDRSCAAILTKAYEDLTGKDLNLNLCLMISTQEEVGGRGAVTGSWNAVPDYAIVSDVTFARSTDGKQVITELGRGAAIGVGPNMNPALTKELVRYAEENGIAHQIEVCPGRSGTNAEEIQLTRTGVSTALVSLPLRYMHTPSEVVSLEDMESVRKLVAGFAAWMEG